MEQRAFQINMTSIHSFLHNYFRYNIILYISILCNNIYNMADTAQLE